MRIEETRKQLERLVESWQHRSGCVGQMEVAEIHTLLREMTFWEVLHKANIEQLLRALELQLDSALAKSSFIQASIAEKWRTQLTTLAARLT